MKTPARSILLTMALLGLSLLQLPAQTPNFPSVKDYGATGDGVTDDLPAFKAAITASLQQGSSVYPVRGIVVVPPGTYFLNETLVLENSVRLLGNGSGQEGGNWISTLKFPADKVGIRITKANQDSDMNGADGSIIEGLKLEGGGGSVTTAHGIAIEAQAKIRDCTVVGFRGSGIDINIAAFAGAITGKWSIEMVTLDNNGSHGLSVSGSGSGAGLATSVSTKNNGGWGISETTGFGNTYVSCSATGNALGFYKTGTGSDSNNLFFGCRSDTGQPAADISSPSIVMGGYYHEIIGSAYLLLDGEVASIVARNTALTASVKVGEQDFGALLSLNDPDNPAAPFRLKYITGSWVLDWANLSSGCHLQLFNGEATPANGYSRDLSSQHGAIGLPGGYYGTNMKYRGEADSPPASGTWVIGDIIYNLQSSPGGYAGWVCTTGGTPGVWKGFGMLEP